MKLSEIERFKRDYDKMSFLFKSVTSFYEYCKLKAENDIKEQVY